MTDKINQQELEFLIHNLANQNEALTNRGIALFDKLMDQKTVGFYEINKE